MLVFSTIQYVNQKHQHVNMWNVTIVSPQQTSGGSYVQQVPVASDVGGLLLREDMQYVSLRQCANVCTLKNVSVCMGTTVTPCLHMYECVCMRAAVSGGAKWANRGKKKKKPAMLMTHLSHATRWRKEREHVPLQR